MPEKLFQDRGQAVAPRCWLEALHDCPRYSAWMSIDASTREIEQMVCWEIYGNHEAAAPEWIQESAEELQCTTFQLTQEQEWKDRKRGIVARYLDEFHARCDRLLQPVPVEQLVRRHQWADWHDALNNLQGQGFKKMSPLPKKWEPTIPLQTWLRSKLHYLAGR